MSYVIEKDVPPPVHAQAGWGMRAAFRAMSVGDSVLIPGKHINSVSQATRQAVPDAKFTCRTVDGGVRVWRLA